LTDILHFVCIREYALVTNKNETWDDFTWSSTFVSIIRCCRYSCHRV